MASVTYETATGTETETPDQVHTSGSNGMAVLIWTDGDGRNSWRMKIPLGRIIRIEEEL